MYCNKCTSLARTNLDVSISQILGIVLRLQSVLLCAHFCCCTPASRPNEVKEAGRPRRRRKVNELIHFLFRAALAFWCWDLTSLQGANALPRFNDLSPKYIHDVLPILNWAILGNIFCIFILFLKRKAIKQCVFSDGIATKWTNFATKPLEIKWPTNH